MRGRPKNNEMILERNANTIRSRIWIRYTFSFDTGYAPLYSILLTPGTFPVISVIGCVCRTAECCVDLVVVFMAKRRSGKEVIFAPPAGLYKSMIFILQSAPVNFLIRPFDH